MRSRRSCMNLLMQPFITVIQLSQCLLVQVSQSLASNCLAGVINNGLYVFGGRTQADQISSDMWVYDLPSLTWNKINYATPNDSNILT
jgi:hypothetical protein